MAEQFAQEGWSQLGVLNQDSTLSSLATKEFHLEPLFHLENCPLAFGSLVH